MKKAAYKKRKSQNKAGLLLVMIVIIMLIVVVSIKSFELRSKQAAYAKREAELQEQIEAEQNRTQELEELRKYTKTKKYIEEVAKDKLGLVYDGEIVFEPEN